MRLIVRVPAKGRRAGPGLNPALERVAGDRAEDRREAMYARVKKKLLPEKAQVGVISP